MRGSDIYQRDRDLDEYEEDEQYEEDGEEEAEYEGEDHEEEEPQLTKDQLEYLERRQKLKEIERQKMKKNGLVVASTKEKTPARDSFGSFFGPSQPVVAKRVIEESRAMLDLHLISASGPKASSQQNKNARHIPSANTKSTQSKQPRRPVDQIKTKIEKLKEARDYSFLLSGDAEFPAPAKEPAVQKKPVPTSDVRPSQVAANRKPSESKKPANLLHAAHDRKQTVSAGRSLPTIGAEKGASTSKLKSSGGHMMLPTGNARNGERKFSHTSNGQNAESRKLPAGNVRNGEPRKLPATTAGNGPGRPMVTKVSDQRSQGAILDRKKSAHATIQSNPSGSAPKTSLPKQQISVQRRHVEQERQPQRAEKTTAKMTSLLPTSSMSAKVATQRPTAIKQQNGKLSKPLPSRPMSSNKTKKRRADEYSDEEDGDGGDYRSMIRQMFRYDPRRYGGVDEDDSDMEVGFDRIEAEERRSARIAKEEDERELALIEEEERRERQRKEAKRQKLKHSQR
ncbi:uncharacterized protein LOC116249783 isoform X1 [Nymphaea colorata]|nr:uncharacterized protein LOC116249783 isoform X1 [Nymphaea colorata]